MWRRRDLTILNRESKRRRSPSPLPCWWLNTIQCPVEVTQLGIQVMYKVPANMEYLLIIYLGEGHSPCGISCGKRGSLNFFQSVKLLAGIHCKRLVNQKDWTGANQSERDLFNSIFFFAINALALRAARSSRPQQGIILTCLFKHLLFIWYISTS